MRGTLSVLVVAVIAASCTDSPTSFEEGIAGTYKLETVGGTALPVTFINQPPNKVEITASEILMGLNGSFREIDTYRITQNTSVTTQVDTFTGTWIQSSTSNITLTAQDDSGPITLSGVYDGIRTLTFTDQGVSFVYRR